MIGKPKHCVGYAMKSLNAVAVVVLASWLASGCATQKLSTDARLAYEAFIGQRRSYHAVALRGRDMAISITGADELVLEAPLNPLSALSNDNDTVPRLVDSAARVALGIAGIEALRQIGTQPPTVVPQPEPMIVRPEVIHVP